MNRALVLGLAMFFAVVGIVLLGGEDSKVMAGHGCNGCSGWCSGDCGGHHGCGGRRFRLFGHRNRCCGHNDCCGYNDCCGDNACNSCGDSCGDACHAEPSCCGYEAPTCAGYEGDASGEDEVGPPDDAEVSEPSAKRAPFGFRKVHFRR